MLFRTTSNAKEQRLMRIKKIFKKPKICDIMPIERRHRFFITTRRGRLEFANFAKKVMELKGRWLACTDECGGETYGQRYICSRS